MMLILIEILNDFAVSKDLYELGQSFFIFLLWKISEEVVHGSGDVL